MALQSIEDTFLVQVDCLQGHRLLRKFDEASSLVEAMQVVPLSEELAQLTANVQISRQLVRQSKSSDSL